MWGVMMMSLERIQEPPMVVARVNDRDLLMRFDAESQRSATRASGGHHDPTDIEQHEHQYDDVTDSHSQFSLG
jgi:hypothetical protein